MRLDLLERTLEARSQKRRVCHLRFLDSHEEALVVDGAEVTGRALSPTLEEAVDAALRHDRSGTVDADEGRVFLEVMNPPLRLLVVGAVHIAQALVPMALRLGYAVTVAIRASVGGCGAWLIRAFIR